MSHGHRVLLVRQWDAAQAGSGCCGGPVGGGICEDHPRETGGSVRGRDPAEAMGTVYRTLRSGLPADVDVQIVDPRNVAYPLPLVMSDARRAGSGWLAALREAARAVGPAVIVVDGRVVSHGILPEPDDALRAVRAALGLLAPSGGVDTPGSTASDRAPDTSPSPAGTSIGT